LPFGQVAARELDFLDELVGVAFGAATLRLGGVGLPERAYAPERAQFDANVFLDELYARLPDRCLRVVGVTEVDLFVPGRTFVFGYAHLSDGVAMFSQARLRQTFYGQPSDAERLRMRVCRAVVHELGHTFGNTHCEGRCVMHAVSQVDTLDALAPSYCAGCRARVEEGLGIAPWSAIGRWQRGMTHLRRRSYVEAARAFEHAVGAAPLEPRYHHDLGTTRLLLGDHAGARAALRRAVELGGDGHAQRWTVEPTPTAAEGGGDDPPARTRRRF
jgi:archaemetzincin